jgi:PhoH-like ATPase
MKQKQTTYVVDTSVLINEPDIFFKLGKCQIIIPTAVIRELDGLKNHTVAATASSARKASRTLDNLGSRQNIASGAKTSVGSTVRICNRFQTVNDLSSYADNKIVGTALKISENSETPVIMLTTDGNMRNIARAHGLRAEPYPFVNGNIHAETEIVSPTNLSWNIISALIVAVMALYIFINGIP